MGCLLAMALGLAAGPACKDKVDDAEQIRTLIRDAARAASERDMDGVMAPVPEDFVGELGTGGELFGDGSGGIKRKELRLLLFRYLRRGSAPRVVIRSIDVQVQKTQASAEVMALLAQGLADLANPAPGQAEALKLELQLEKRDKRWWVVRAKRTPIDPKRLLLAE